MRVLIFPVSLLALLAAASLPLTSLAELPAAVSADNPLLLYSGRRDDTKQGEVRLGYSGARVRIAFEGAALGLRMESAQPNWVDIFIDGKRTDKIKVEGSYAEVAAGLGNGIHTAEIVKATEGAVGPVVFKGISLPEGGKAVEWPAKQTRKIEFIGDSITCGYGIEANDPLLHFTPETENFCDAYAWRAARALNADYLVVARSGIGMLRNCNGPADGSPDNMPAIYTRTLFYEPSSAWDPARFVPDVVCINLGTNDFSTPDIKPEKYAAAYLTFLDMLLDRYPAARVVLLIGPMQNSQQVKDILAQVAEAANKDHAGRVSFFALSKQGGHGFGADYHPSREQAKINGVELTDYLSGLMGWPADGMAE